MRRVLLTTFVLFAALLGTACSDDKSPSSSGSSSAPPGVGDLGGVTVTGDPGAKPALSFGWPYSASEVELRVINEGTGEQVAPGAKVTIDYVTVNGKDGSELESSFGSASSTTVVLDDKVPSAIVRGLVGSKVGSRLLISVPPGDNATDTYLFVIDLKAVRHPLARATGTPVTPTAGGLPSVNLDGDGKPTITLPSTATPPASLVVQPLIAGAGASVAAGQTVTVHYTGVIWATGKQFDSSWDRGAPVDFGIGMGRVIPGWDEGLVGQPVGSQVLLVIPPDKGYGAAGNSEAGIAGTDTLVFVVDILDAT